MCMIQLKLLFYYKARDEIYRKSKNIKRKGCVLKILLIKDRYYDATFKQEQYFI